MAKVAFKPNKKNTPLLWPETDRLLERTADRVADANNAAFAATDPRRVVRPISDQAARKRHRAAVIAASGAARRDQARTNRFLSALSRTRV